MVFFCFVLFLFFFNRRDTEKKSYQLRSRLWHTGATLCKTDNFSVCYVDKCSSFRTFIFIFFTPWILLHPDISLRWLNFFRENNVGNTFEETKNELFVRNSVRHHLLLLSCEINLWYFCSKKVSFACFNEVTWGGVHKPYHTRDRNFRFTADYLSTQLDFWEPKSHVEDKYLHKPKKNQLSKKK